MAKPVPPILKFLISNILFIVTGIIGLGCLWLTIFGKMEAEKLAIVISALAAFLTAAKAKST